MKLTDLAPPYIRNIAPYQPGKPISELERELGLTGIIKLASNENPLGASPAALKAVQAELGQLALYPDGNGFVLKSALARKFGVNPDGIVLGQGSNEVLQLVVRAFMTPAHSAVYSQYAFAVYPLEVQAVGARGIEVPARNFGHDLHAMRAAIDSTTRLVFVANPNNPTGTLAAADQILAFLAAVPKQVLVVLDEAYTEYLPPAMRYDSFGWLKQFPNLVISRTFSKAYGLAGLRVGYALAHPAVADLMNRIRPPFNVNSLALAAAAAALEDDAFLARSFQVNMAGLAQLSQGFDKLGLSYIRSVGNFMAVRVGDGAAVYQRLLKCGVIVRPVANYGMPEYLRVTVGLPEQNDKFLSALERSLQ